MTAVTTVNERTLPADAEGWTVDDLDHLSEDDLRYELVDGCLVVSPPPPNEHNSEAFYLGVRILSALSREWIIATPGAIEFDVHNWRQPDLLVYRRSARGQKYAGRDDVLLAVEVMSRTRSRRDLPRDRPVRRPGCRRQPRAVALRDRRAAGLSRFSTVRRQALDERGRRRKARDMPTDEEHHDCCDHCR